MCFLVIIIILLVVNTLPGITDVIHIRQGKLKGTILKARNGTLFKAYYGIPYAEPPIGKLRLQSPSKPKSWSGMLNASVKPTQCIQIKENTQDTIIGSEDCLYLNIFTPLNATEGDNYPVIIFLYGGYFQNGGSTFYKPFYIMQKNIILVEINFRDGPLGFLSTGDSVISGNFGLKDQTMSLKWIKKNIRAFGGDPNQITLQGHSSGAMSAHFHTLSPLSQGLFNKVIIQSGSAFSQISYFGPDVSRSIANEFADRAGCSTISSQEMLSCFLLLDAHVFYIIASKMYIWHKEPTAIFRPTTESNDVKDAFFNEFPFNATYKSKNIPWLIGLTTNEGAYVAKDYLFDESELTEEINDNYNLIFPILVQYLWNTKREHLDYTTQILKNHYFKNRKVDANTSVEFVDLFTEGLFGWGIIDAIRRYNGPKYVYLYDYISNYSMSTARNGTYLGIDHSDELYLLFYTELSASYLNATDIIFGDELITRWINFAYSGDPNIPFAINETMFSTWEPMSTKQIEYLRIKINGTMEKNLYKGKYEFWKGLPVGNKYI